MAASVFHVGVIPTEPRPHESFPPSEKSTFRVWTVCSHEKGAFILPPTKTGGSGSKRAMLRERLPTLLAELVGLDGCSLEGQQLQRGQGWGEEGGAQVLLSVADLGTQHLEEAQWQHLATHPNPHQSAFKPQWSSRSLAQVLALDPQPALLTE